MNSTKQEFQYIINTNPNHCHC